MGRSIKQITSKVSTISENIQKRINEYYFRTTTSQSKNVEPVPKSSQDLFQNNKTERAIDDDTVSRAQMQHRGIQLQL